MPLPSPILDDRSYQQLRDELIRRIPVYAPEWTDRNASDPGITLIELFAFLGENLLFRFNQIPDATKLAFLRLLKIPLRPAASSRAMVTLKNTDPTGAAVLVPIATEMRAGSVPFQSLTEVSAWPLEITAMGKIVAPAPDAPDSLEFTQASIDARGGIKAGEQAAYYISQVVPGDPASSGATPVDFSIAGQPVDYQKSVDGAIWIAVRKTKTTDLQALDGQLLALGFVPDPDVPSMEEVEPCPGLATDSGVEMIWQASTGIIDDKGLPTFTTIKVEGDTTRGLAGQGTVQLRLPDDVATLGVFALTDIDRAGTDSFPPQIEDADLAAEVIFWLRATRRDPARPLGKVLFIGINATEVAQMIKAPAEFVGTGTAQASQTYHLVHRPAVDGTTRVQVEEASQGMWTDWQAVTGFEDSHEDSRHYVLDPEAGTITFGNGVRGRAPQIGERIRALEYRYGGGAEGNVAAAAISKVVGVGNVTASNPLPASGGAPGESVAEGLERVPAEFRRHDRAVTESDFQELALATPGAGVGRAECLALFDPRTKASDAAGVVTVVVWPRDDLKHPNAPRPDRTLINQVCRWLDARRLVTTELNVIPPTYRKIAVSVGLQAKPGYGIEAVRRWVELVVRQYLAPLPPYGPSGGGWPLGRPVYGPELEAAALQVEGVQFIECLRLAVWDEASQQWKEAEVTATSATSSACAPRENIPLERWEVPEVSEITVVQGEALPPGEALGPVTPPLVPIPIPTIPSEC